MSVDDKFESKITVVAAHRWNYLLASVSASLTVNFAASSAVYFPKLTVGALGSPPAADYYYPSIGCFSEVTIY